MGTAFKILCGQLAAMGCDGLYNVAGGCACSVQDLAPCGGIQEDCMPGKCRMCECGDWFAVPPESTEQLCEVCRPEVSIEPPVQQQPR
jgi:hypothetical protein